MGSSRDMFLIRTNIEDAWKLVLQDLKRNGYILSLSEEKFDRSFTEAIQDRFSGFVGEDLDVIVVTSLENGWCRILGFEELSSPKLTHSLDLIALSGCDALECGYIDGIGWWYVLYNQGSVVDRFDSNPEESYYGRAYRGAYPQMYLEPFDPADPREIYLSSVSSPMEYVSFPDEIQHLYTGVPQKFSFLISDPLKIRELSSILARKIHPESAYIKFCKILGLPDQDLIRATDVCNELYRSLQVDSVAPSRDIDSAVLEMLKHGVKAAILQRSQ